MTIDPKDLQVKHNTKAEQFEIHLGKQVALLQYKRMGEVLVFYHTEVPEAFEGQGVASQLGFAAMEYVKQNSLKAVPRCEFMEVYLRRHKEYREWIA
ncbi:MAG: N-acetyltransferase [Chloroflexi bacterium]|nr:N-acetyltransferase [Chloroflexota bacterium]